MHRLKPGGHAGVLLTAVVSDDHVARAVELIKRHGGRVWRQGATSWQRRQRAS